MNESIDPKHIPMPFLIPLKLKHYADELEDGCDVIDKNGGLVFAGLSPAEATFIVRAVNSHEELLTAAKDSLAIIKRLADEKGMFFDDIDKEMGLEGKLMQAIAKAEGKS